MHLLPALAGTPTRNIIHNMDALSFLCALPEESVHCMVTSPPYWGLRDYGVPGQLGMESTLAEYISNMVMLFREARRVLRSDGVLWLNMGDGYATSPNGRSAKNTKAAGNDDRTFRDKPMSTIGGSLKPKDLMMQPHRLAIALQDDGWYVRADCVWHKPNPMPESISDRPTKAHEYVFLLTKSERYWYDPEPVKTPVKPNSIKRRGRAVSVNHKNAQGAPGQAVHSMFKPRENAHRNDGAGTQSRRTFDEKFAPKHDDSRWDSGGPRQRGFDESYSGQVMPMANLRSVWVIPARGFKGAHFATFPIELPKICILTGCPSKTCAECGAPYVRVNEKQFYPQLTSEHNIKGAGAQKPMDASNGWQGVPRGVVLTETLGWKPTCTCDTTDTRPGLVLDMFMGSGTTAVVAKLLNRDYIGSELNPEYIKLAEKRIARPRRQRFEEPAPNDLPPLLQLIQQIERKS